MQRYRVTTPKNHPMTDGSLSEYFLVVLEIEGKHCIEVHPETGQILLIKEIGDIREIMAVYPNTVIFERLKGELN